jgi:hypothetical protein
MHIPIKKHSLKNQKIIKKERKNSSSGVKKWAVQKKLRKFYSNE